MAIPSHATGADAPLSVATSIPADLLRAIMAAVPPRNRSAVRAATKAWTDADALDVLLPAHLPSPPRLAPFAGLRGLDLRSATGLTPASLTAALRALPSLVALALRDDAEFSLLAAVAAARPQRVRVLRLECVHALPAGQERAARLGGGGGRHGGGEDAGAAVLDVLGACVELDVAGRRAVWGLIDALREAGVGPSALLAGMSGEDEGDGRGGEEGGVHLPQRRPPPPDSPRSEPEDAWEADHGGGGIDDDAAALAAEAAALRDGGGVAGGDLRPAPDGPPRLRRRPALSPLPPGRFSSLRRLSLDLAFPAAPTRPPDTRAGTEPWVGDPSPLPLPPPGRGGADDSREAIRAADDLFCQPLALPSLAHFSLTCPGGRDRAGLPGYDDWAAAATPDSPTDRAVDLAFTLPSMLHTRHRSGRPGLASLSLVGWPVAAAGAHPRTLAVLAASCPGLEVLRLDGGPGPTPDLSAWESSLSMTTPPPVADAEVGLAGVVGHAHPPTFSVFARGRPAFQALHTLELGPGLFIDAGTGFAAAAGAGALPALRRFSLAGPDVVGAGGWEAERGGGLGGAAARGGLRALRCSAAHVKAATGAPTGLSALDLRADGDAATLSPDDVACLAPRSPGLVAAALPLGGRGWAGAGAAAAAFRALSTHCRRLSSLTLELWGAGTSAAVLPALGDLLAACPVADLEVAVEMGAGAGAGDDDAAAPPEKPGCSPACAALTAALARGRHLRRVCVRRVPGGVCDGLVAALASAAPSLAAVILVCDRPPALPPGLAADLAARRVALGTPRSGPAIIPSPMHHVWWPGGGGGAVGKTAIASADARSGAGAGWPPGWRPAVGPAPGAATAGVLWWHTAPVTADGDPGGEAAARVVPGDAYSAAAAAARWWGEPAFC